jgi:hypothetical protein
MVRDELFIIRKTPEEINESNFMNKVGSVGIFVVVRKESQ